MRKFIIAPVAAVVMLGLSGTAFAQADNETGVDIYKHVNITNKINYKGEALVGGQIGVSQLGMAVIKNQQGTMGNYVKNFRNTNNASISDGSASGLTGNSGVNVAAGDNNVQANNTALTVLGKGDASANPGETENGEGSGEGERGFWPSKPAPVVFAKGASVDAEIGSSQFSTQNNVKNEGNHNNANVSDGSLSDSAGNLGANVAAGNGNVQANNFALSYGEKANLAVSTVNNSQVSTGNNISNRSLMEESKGESVKMTLSGNISGTYDGTSKQSNDVYPEIWIGGTEKVNHDGSAKYWGHADFDDKAKSGQDGRFEFADTGTVDLGKVSLSGKLATINHTVGRTNVNNANISGGSLNNAAGNIGVNVAAGTNNLQSNSMALSVGNF